MVSYREDFDKLSCGKSGCSHDHELAKLVGKCHPDSGVFAYYRFKGHALCLICAECKQGILDIEVGTKEHAYFEQKMHQEALARAEEEVEDEAFGLPKIGEKKHRDPKAKEKAKNGELKRKKVR